MGTFRWYSETSNFNPQTRYFQKNVKYRFFNNEFLVEYDLKKLNLREIGIMDMSFIMDFAENHRYTTFPNIFSSISAESADLSHNQKNHIFEKKSIFWVKNLL